MSTILTEATLVPDSLELDELMDELRSGGLQMALVIDEFGDLDGLVTLEDLVEEIIGELLQMDSRSLLDFTRMTGAVVEGIRQVPMPVVAAVNGVAAGAGAVIALASDLRILARSARFHFLFTKVGLAGADMGSAYLLPRVIGLGRATELLMLGERVEAARALEIGLASQVVDDDALDDAASSLARRLAEGPTFAYAATKKLLTAEQDMSLSAALEMEAMTQALLMTTDDHAEFHRAFTEKRDPNWSGR